MTGPEHYREAQSLTALVAGAARNDDLTEALLTLQLAEVHATLALAAATALGSPGRDGSNDADGMGPADRLAWEDAASAAAPIHSEHDDDLAAGGDYDPGPEVDDEGGMSEYRYAGPEGEPF